MQTNGKGTAAATGAPGRRAMGLGLALCAAAAVRPVAVRAQTLRGSFRSPYGDKLSGSAYRATCVAAARADAGRVARLAGQDSADAANAVSADGACPTHPILAEIYADANVRRSISQSDGGTVAAGSLGAFFFTGRWAADVFVNTVGTSTAVRGDYGLSLLVPGSGGSFNSGLLEARHFLGDYNARRRLGLRGYASVSSGRWQPPDTARSAVGFVGSALGVGGFFSIGGRMPASVAARAGNDPGGSKTVSAVLDVGAAYRSLGGDVSDGHSADGNVLKLRDDLGVATMRHWSPEVGITIGYNDLKAGLTWYQFGGRMRGFSRGQVVAGISVQSTLASGFLTP